MAPGPITGSVVFAFLCVSLTHGLIIDNKYSPWDFLITPGSDHPTPREGHSATLIGQNIYVFGGYYPARPLWGPKRLPTQIYNQLFALNVNSLEWSRVSGTFVNTRDVSDHSTSGIDVAVPASITEEDLKHHRHWANLTSKSANHKPARQTSGDSPAPTADHAAAAVGNVLYVFGGIKLPGNVATNDLWAYIPAQNAWTLVTSGVGPSARAGAVAWGTRNRLFVFGGYDPATKELKTDTWAFDAALKKWSVIQTAVSSSTVPGARVFGSVVQTPIGQLMYSGRQNAPYSPLALATDAIVYGTNGWESRTITKKDNYPNPVADAAIAYDDGFVVVVGGYAGPYSTEINRCGWYSPDNSNYEGYDPVGEVRIYNVDDDTWIRGTDAPFFVNRNVTARIGRAPAVQYGNALILFGGVGCEDVSGRGIKPYSAIYGQFNQIPIYNLLSDPRSAASHVSMGTAVVVCVLLWVMAM